MNMVVHLTNYLVCPQVLLYQPCIEIIKPPAEREWS